MADQRSDEAQSYRRFYKLDAWRRRRLMHLSEHPLCKMCLSAGVTQAANIVDHVIPHRGNWDLFIGGELQSLCKFHHDSVKQSEERRGYVEGIGADGWPMDPRHPTHKAG